MVTLLVQEGFERLLQRQLKVLAGHPGISICLWMVKFEVFGIVCPQVTPNSIVLMNRNHWANPYTGVGLVLNHQYFEPNSPCFIIFLDLYANTKFFTSSPHVS